MVFLPVQLKQKLHLVLGLHQEDANMHNLYDLFCVIDEYTAYLREKDFEFSQDGSPVLRKEMFLNEIPDMMVPVNHRKDRRVVNRKKTVLVFFCGDVEIYRRLPKLLSEIDEYRTYMGVVGPDVTVTADMDDEWQRAIMFLTQLAMAVMACNGIKVVLNTRTGGTCTREMLGIMPRGVMVASGFLGGDSKYDKADFSYVAKMLRLMPAVILIYGSCSAKLQEKLDRVGLNCVVYTDFRRLCKEAT